VATDHPASGTSLKEYGFAIVSIFYFQGYFFGRIYKYSDVIEPDMPLEKSFFFI
jgi:hypothetical protein